ncbi:MAG: transcriptional regulator NrdR [Patescibacteria group bacterium]|nr:transcriptional regulator NrdR [Patescibacteria group bacterium]
MKCPYCNNGDSRVVDSRVTDDGKTVRRRRECEKCNARFSTQEQIEILNLTVIKRDGRKEEYKKEKIEEAITRAANKRLKEEDISQLVSDIENEVHARGKCEITSRDVGNIALKKLQEKDEVSYLRFASVFKSFGSGERFVKELTKLEKEDS